MRYAHQTEETISRYRVVLAFTTIVQSVIPEAQRADEVQNSDAIMNIEDGHWQNIVQGVETHDFRTYFIPHTVERPWFYTAASSLRLNT